MPYRICAILLPLILLAGCDDDEDGNKGESPRAKEKKDLVKVEQIHTRSVAPESHPVTPEEYEKLKLQLEALRKKYKDENLRLPVLIDKSDHVLLPDGGGPTVNNLKIKLVANKTQLKPGETAMLKIFFCNLSNHDIILDTGWVLNRQTKLHRPYAFKFQQMITKQGEVIVTESWRWSCFSNIKLQPTVTQQILGKAAIVIAATLKCDVLKNDTDAQYALTVDNGYELRAIGTTVRLRFLMNSPEFINIDEKTNAPMAHQTNWRGSIYSNEIELEILPEDKGKDSE